MKRSSLIICLVLVSLLVVAGIPIAAATPTISDVRPGSGPNTQTITVTITGSGFSDSSNVWLKKCGVGSDMIDGTITSRSATELTATFPLSGHKVGDYDVKVNTPSTLFGGSDDIGVMAKGFEVYTSSGSSTKTTTTTTGTTTVTTYATESEGENSVFFETNPTGATIFLDGSEIGTSTFTYYTDMDGSHEVIVKKIGYEDYEDRVNIAAGGQRTRFYAQLTLLSSSGTTTPVKTVSGQPGKTVTTIKKSTIRLPTPLGTDPPLTEESPSDPATVLWAAVLGIAIVVFRRR
ncbi:MAG: PEGA domain-containing protein [Methanoregula sp.]|jgi:hypothetical protein